MKNNQDRHQNYSVPKNIPQPQSQVVEMLNQTLSTTTDLKIYLRQTQRNQYINCYQPHAVFDETVALLDEYIDLFKALLIALDGTTTDCPKKQLALLNDPSNIILSVKNHITALATRLEPYAKLLRQANYRFRT